MSDFIQNKPNCEMHLGGIRVLGKHQFFAIKKFKFEIRTPSNLNFVNQLPVNCCPLKKFPIGFPPGPRARKIESTGGPALRIFPKEFSVLEFWRPND
jgi:hypothetical protein